MATHPPARKAGPKGAAIELFVSHVSSEAKIAACLRDMAHLGVGVRSRDEVDRLCRLAREERCLAREPEDSGPPVGYWALIRDPDGHTLEVAFGQELRLAVESAC